MRTIMVMYDTLCRNFLSPYGNTWVQTPNFSDWQRNPSPLTQIMCAACPVCRQGGICITAG